MEPKNMLDKATPPPLPKTMNPSSYNIEENYGIIDWFKKGMRNYVNFSGRARRKEYWYFLLMQIILIIIAMVLDTIIFDSEIGLFYLVVALGLFLPGVAVTIRRLHDTSHSGWWFLISLVPLIGIVLIVFLVRETKFETNQWGPPAK
ncbi:DUF805 domain-containing protein [Psychrobacter sp. AOP22-C1-C5]|uniref:DUF805 domain-containing protein n=1 Tax=Psychrobacter sp. AOP22-C1-C5 TaxID=3457716 RepID=UPI0040357931